MDVAWNLSALSRHTATAASRGTSANHSAARAKVANVARHLQFGTACYIQRSESPLHSEFVGRPPATLEKRSPINISLRCVRDCSRKTRFLHTRHYLQISQIGVSTNRAPDQYESHENAHSQSYESSTDAVYQGGRLGNAICLCQQWDSVLSGDDFPVELIVQFGFSIAKSFVGERRAPDVALGTCVGVLCGNASLPRHSNRKRAIRQRRTTRRNN